MYAFALIQHGIILTQSILVGLTPLIPIPIVDDAVKNFFLRGMVRQITAGRGVTLTPAQIEALIQEDFWDGCITGCIGAVGYLLRELVSKVFFFLEWRRAFLLIAQTYNTGFLLDAALLDGYPLAGVNGSTVEAARLREAIRRTRYRANDKLILQLIRKYLRPSLILRTAWLLVRRAVVSVPRVLLAIPVAIWRAIRSVPGQVLSFPRRIRQNFQLRVQVLFGKQKAPELAAIQRVAQSMQAALLKMDTNHFDVLRARLWIELGNQPNAPALPQPPQQSIS